MPQNGNSGGEGGGELQKNLSMVEVCIYSGTTHLKFYELILPDIFSYM